VSIPEMMDQAANHQGMPNGDDGQARTPVVPAPSAGRLPTGDDAVDEALSRLDAATDEPLDSQIQVGEQVHRVLQGRLADLGKE
jgi:hypothetical protein